MASISGMLAGLVQPSARSRRAAACRTGHRAGQAIDHDRAGGRAEQHVLQRCLGAQRGGLAEAGQHVAGQGGHLHRDHQHQQVRGGRPSAHMPSVAPSSSVKNSGPSPSCIVLRQRREPHQHDADREHQQQRSSSTRATESTSSMPRNCAAGRFAAAEHSPEAPCPSRSAPSRRWRVVGLAEHQTAPAAPRRWPRSGRARRANGRSSWKAGDERCADGQQVAQHSAFHAYLVKTAYERPPRSGR